jgi:hypothetical protein
MSSICKYCNKVELTFDKFHVSKSGKMIPLDKNSGMPHQCSENPYSQQQPKQQRQQQAPQEQPKFRDYNLSEDSVQRGITAFSMVTNLTILVEQTQKQLVSMDAKLDRIISMLGKE